MPYMIGNFSISSSDYAWFTNAAGNDCSAITGAYGAYLQAILGGDTAAQARDAAVQAAEQIGTSNLVACTDVSVAMATTIVSSNVTGPVAGSLTAGTATIVLVNNTAYSLYTSPDSANEQFFVNRGSLLTLPAGSITPAYSGSIYTINSSGGYGASGAFWACILDPSNDNDQIGGLCMAYSAPLAVDASPSCEVAYNQVLASWFKTFNGQSPTTLSNVELPASQNYPALYARAGINSLSPLLMAVTIST